jgi:hypothetical protein
MLFILRLPFTPHSNYMAELPNSHGRTELAPEKKTGV